MAGYNSGRRADRGAKKWVLRFLWQGNRPREDGARQLSRGRSCAEAREEGDRRAKARAQRCGPDRRRRRRDRGIPTFGELADEIAGQLAEGFRNEKHRAQWRMTLTVYAGPLRAKPVNKIETTDVLAVLRPIWQGKPETASRLRGRIERVLNAAKAKGLRSGENPAAWRGHLENLLPKRQKLTRGHHAAMPYADVPAFVARLRERDAVAALALEFAILTAARSGEVLGARWREIDFGARIWTIPPQRMKAAREHRVPLSESAFAILEKLGEARVSEFIFPGQGAGRPLAEMVLRRMLRRDADVVTVHGFRSSFRDWAGNETHFPRELAEAALAHVVGDKAEQAYQQVVPMLWRSGGR